MAKILIYLLQYSNHRDEFVRVVTNIVDDSGNRINDSKLEKGSDVYNSIKNGKLFLEEATILEVNILLPIIHSLMKMEGNRYIISWR